MPKFYGQNKRHRNPRYFLHEDIELEEELRQGSVNPIKSLQNKMADEMAKDHTAVGGSHDGGPGHVGGFTAGNITAKKELERRHAADAERLSVNYKKTYASWDINKLNAAASKMYTNLSPEQKKLANDFELKRKFPERYDPSNEQSIAIPTHQRGENALREKLAFMRALLEARPEGYRGLTTGFGRKTPGAPASGVHTVTTPET